MSVSTQVPRNERGVIRVFALSMTDQEARRIQGDAAAVSKMLGADGLLDVDHVEMFPVSDLEGVGLSGYLADGAGVPEEQLAPDRAKLDKLGGWVLILFSQAFEDRAATLRPASALTLISTYGDTRPDWRATDAPPPEAAKPYSGATAQKKRPSDAAMSGRIAMLVLILLAIFTYLFIRIAG